MKVYSLVGKVPCGKVTTYGEVARALGSPRACRAVGSALKKNPFFPNVPCHRVVCSDGSIGGFFQGRRIKELLLRKEGIQVIRGKVVGHTNVFYRFC